MNKIADITVGDLRGLGPLGLEGVSGGGASVVTATLTFVTLLTTTVGIMTIIAVIWLLFKIIIGAISIISSGGDKAKVAEGRNNITFGLTGFVIVISATFIISLIGYIFGVNFLRLSVLIGQFL